MSLQIYLNFDFYRLGTGPKCNYFNIIKWLNKIGIYYANRDQKNQGSVLGTDVYYQILFQFEFKLFQVYFYNLCN